MRWLIHRSQQERVPITAGRSDHEVTTPVARAAARPGGVRSRPMTLVSSLMVALLALGLAAGSAAAAQVTGGSSIAFTTVQSDHFTFIIQASAPDITAFAEVYGPVAERSLDQLTTILGGKLPGKITVAVYADQAAYNSAVKGTKRTEPEPEAAFADPAKLAILIPLSPFKALSAIEAENTLRHAIAHLLVANVSNNNAPPGFDEGIAAYVETPVTAKIARLAAILQNANQSGALLSWSELNREPQPDASPDLIAAEDYATADFLLDRYGVHTFRDFLQALHTQSDWRLAMRAAYQRSPDDMERAWQQNLQNWTSGGWQNNVLAALDLQPARDYLAKANYDAAKALLQQSQRLYTDLEDQQDLAEVSRLLQLCDTGIQAGSLMMQTQQALEQHTYDRAESLLAQARAEYDQLPENQRPVTLLNTYDQLAQQGITASQQLAQASQQAHHWADYRTARATALAAGTTFAALGDSAEAQQSAKLLQRLDTRERRLIFLLGGLAALTVGWLLLWLWTREPSRIDWG